MIFDSFDAPNPEQFRRDNYNTEQFGYQILNAGFEVSEAAIALIGIQESDYPVEADLIRASLYDLYVIQPNSKLIDLGNYQLLGKEQFSYDGLADVIAELDELNVLPIIFGGSEKTTLALQQGFALAKQHVNVGSINSAFQFNDVMAEVVTDANYLYKVCNLPESYLFNFMQVGFQTYLVNPKAIQLQKQLNFDEIRLGRIRDNIKEAEPLLRDLDILSVSIDAVKYADTGGCANASPNGLYAEELAQLMRYAGISDKLKCVGLFNLQAGNCVQPKIGAALLAQSIWCFLEGYEQRKREWPDRNDKNFLKYIVHNEEMDLDLIYLKSELSGRWWIQMPKDKAMLKKKFYIPCSYEDYQTALDGDIPERWLKGFNKLG